MKKLLVAALGLGLALGSVSFAAQDTTAQPDTAKKTKKKAKKSKKNADSTDANGKKM